MGSWEEIGRRLDREFARVREVFEKEIKPQTSRKAAAALRAASRRLAEAAEQIEARISSAGGAAEGGGRSGKR